jgi:hypothetical protein
VLPAECGPELIARAKQGEGAAKSISNKIKKILRMFIREFFPVRRNDEG